MTTTPFFLSHKKPTLNRFFVPLTLLSCMLLSSAGYGETNTQLDLASAIQKSLAQHPKLSLYQYRFENLKQQQTAIKQGSRKRLKLGVDNAFGSGSYKSFDQAEISLNLSWLLEDDLIEQKVKHFSRKTETLKLEQRSKRLAIAADTAKRFLLVLAYQERLAFAHTAVKNAQLSLQAIQKRVTAGKTPYAEQLRVEALYQQRLVNLEDMEHELLVAKRLLSVQWGIAEIDFDHAAGDLSQAVKLIPLDELEAQLNNNPQILAYLSQAKLKQSEIFQLQAEQKSRWRFSSGLKNFQASDDIALSAGVQLEFSNQKLKQAQVRALSADKTQLEVQAQQHLIAAKTQVFAYYQASAHNQHLAKSLRTEIIPRLEQALSETRAAYLLGRYSYLEWAAVQQDLLDARMALIEANFNAHLNIIELQRLSGSSLQR